MVDDNPDPLVRVSYRIPRSLKDGLERIRRRDGISEAEQLRRALLLWFHEKGISTPITGD